MFLSGRLELEALARQAWEKYHQGRHEEVEAVYDQLLPYCLRVSSRTCYRYVTAEDEEASIARMALVEAFEKYNPDQGKFLVYLGRVINHRLIDYKRREKRHQGFLHFFSGETSERVFAELVDDQTVDSILDELARQQDIQRLQHLLTQHGISFEDLVGCNPKHAKTRHAVQEVVGQICADHSLRDRVMETGTIPIKELEERFGANRKLIDRFRKYIMASIMIVAYDLSSLRSYVTPEREGRK